MKVPSIKFNTQDRPEFIKELRLRVNQYFQDNNLSKHANFNMMAKTVFMMCLYFVPFVLMVTGVVHTLWPVLLMWVLMGFGMAGLGLSVMHDAIHGAYSKNQKVNLIIGYIIHFIGGYHRNWKIQHNVLHHSFTNVEGFDEDIEIGIMRFSPGQKRKGIHRFQVFYAPFLYGLMTVYWSTVKDFDQLLRYHKKNLLAAQGLSLKQGIFRVAINKIWYFALIVALPMITIDLPWWQILIGIFTMHFICGLILSFIFQLAHVIEETDFFTPDQKGSVENNWAIHQMKTTANFANRSPIFTWLIGGLNFQIEHHLFPYICHVHYKKISKIVQATAAEFQVPYHQHRTFAGALKSHFTLLNQLGTGKYDQKVA